MVHFRNSFQKTEFDLKSVFILKRLAFLSIMSIAQMVYLKLTIKPHDQFLLSVFQLRFKAKGQRVLRQKRELECDFKSEKGTAENWHPIKYQISCF